MAIRFFVVERMRVGVYSQNPKEFAKVAEEDLRYKLKLKKKGKIVAGGPFLDTLGDGYVLETDTVEEMGEILFASPGNFMVDREVHPLGGFADSLEGMEQLRKERK